MSLNKTPSCFWYSSPLSIKNCHELKKAILYSLYANRARHISTQSAVLSDESRSVYRYATFQNKFKNWQHLRRNKLTASTFGRAVGFWPGGRVQLWLEKIGYKEPFAGNLATCWNNIKEEEAFEKYKLITGNEVVHPKFLAYHCKDPRSDFLAASADGTVDSFVYGLASRGVLEIKCPYFNGDKNLSYPWKRIPIYYIPQAQGLMEILDRDWMDMYCWTINGSSLFRLYRDVEYWEILNMALSDFWWEHVQPAKEICYRSVIKYPVLELKSLIPASKHGFHRDIVCRSKLVSNNSELLMREINGELQC